MRRAIIFIAVILVAITAVATYLLLPSIIQDPEATDESSTTDFFGSLFPFGDNDGQNNVVDEGKEETEEVVKTGTPSPLRQVSTEMVAGARFTNKGTSTPVIIRYMERKTGHIYDMPANSYTANRISNTTVPGIDHLIWTSNTTALLQALSEEKIPENFLGRISTTTQTLSGTPLSGFARAAVTGNGTLILATERENGILVETARADGLERQTIFASPIRSWIPLTGGTRVFLHSAPSAATDGFLYELKSGTLSKVVGDVSGFMASVSPTGRYVAYSGRGNTVFQVLDTEKNNVYEIALKTLAAKCGWIPKKEPLLICGVPKTFGNYTYPDDWLLGQAATVDALWLIDPINSETKLISDPEEEANASLDVTNVAVDDTGSYALFTDKNDLTLWSVKLNN